MRLNVKKNLTHGDAEHYAMTEHNEIQLYAARAEVDRLKSELIRIRAERDAAVDAGIQLCVHR